MADDLSATLLPPTATGLARAMDVLEGRLLRLPVEMITKDPAAVDVAWLDQLAWEMSVDVWDPDWPEDVKRSVIAASVEVHRFKGTPHAIRTALAGFDVDTELLEWFEPEGVADGMVPGSFRVTAFAGRSLYGDTENAIDIRMVEAMNAVVQRAAPVSRAQIFRLGERFDGRVGMRTGVSLRRRQSGTIEPATRPATVQAGVGLVSGARLRTISRQTHEPRVRAASVRAGIAIGHAVRVATVSREIHTVKRRGGA